MVLVSLRGDIVSMGGVNPPQNQLRILPWGKPTWGQLEHSLHPLQKIQKSLLIIFYF